MALTLLILQQTYLYVGFVRASPEVYLLLRHFRRCDFGCALFHDVVGAAQDEVDLSAVADLKLLSQAVGV